jgi:hypothetical protein
LCGVNRILFWAVVLGLEPLTAQVVCICTLVSGGVSLACYGETEFSWMGFALVTTACCLSGLRWGLTQVLYGIDHRGRRWATRQRGEEQSANRPGAVAEGMT